MKTVRFNSVKQIWWGIRLLSRDMPSFFVWLTLHSVVMAVTPYAELALFAAVFENLRNRAELTQTLTALFTVLAVAAVLRLFEAALRRVKEAKWDMLFPSVDRCLSDKLLSMDPCDREAPSTNERLESIRETTTALGMGIVQLPLIVQNACRGLAGALTALLLSLGVFAQAGSFWEILLWTAALLLTVWSAERARRQQQTASKSIAEIDRVYYAFLDSINDPCKAADMRLYRQDRTVMKRLQEAQTAFFNEQGIKYRQAHGAKAFYRAFLSACPYAWIAFCALWLLIRMPLESAGVTLFATTFGAWCLLPAELGFVTESVREFFRNRPYLEELFEFLDMPHSMYRGSLTTEKRQDGDYVIELRHVSFTYPNQEKAALSDVSLTIRNGGITAVVGENGSGKSTLVKLLCRLYDPDEGEILLNGIDIRKYRYEEYAALMAVVFQDFSLFEQSVADNIVGQTDGDLSRVKACLRAVGAEEETLSPTMSGGSLSRQQAQRLAIARALYKQAPFLVLDEATAVLGAEEERRLLSGTDVPFKQTTVTVSHRLINCPMCDEIVVLENGRITESGTHEELISLGGTYCTMWNVEANGYNQS